MKLNVPPAIQQAWRDQPLELLGVAALVATAAAKVIDSVSAAQGRKAYAKQVNNSVKKSKRK